MPHMLRYQPVTLTDNQKMAVERIEVEIDRNPDERILWSECGCCNHRGIRRNEIAEALKHLGWDVVLFLERLHASEIAANLFHKYASTTFDVKVWEMGYDVTRDSFVVEKRAGVLYVYQVKGHRLRQIHSETDALVSVNELKLATLNSTSPWVVLE